MIDTTINDGFLDGFDDDVEIVDEPETVDVEETETDVEDVSDADESYEAEEETTEAAEQDPETIDYSYNHQTTALPYAFVKGIAEKLGKTPSDVVTILQKGSNYDVLQSRQDPYRGAIDRIDRFATGNNLSKEDAIKRAIDALDVIDSTRYMEELKKQYPGAAPKYIQDMAMMRVKQEMNTPAAPTKEEQSAEADREKKWVSFFQAHPDVTADNLSPRMIQALEKNEDPEYVYVSEKNADLERQIKELRDKQDKVARSTGTSKRTSGSTGKDAFLDAFLG